MSSADDEFYTFRVRFQFQWIPNDVQPLSLSSSTQILDLIGSAEPVFFHLCRSAGLLSRTFRAQLAGPTPLCQPWLSSLTVVGLKSEKKWACDLPYLQRISLDQLSIQRTLVFRSQLLVQRHAYWSNARYKSSIDTTRAQNRTTWRHFQGIPAAYNCVTCFLLDLWSFTLQDMGLVICSKSVKYGLLLLACIFRTRIESIPAVHRWCGPGAI